MARQGRTEGFTLAELMLAMAVLSVLSLVSLRTADFEIPPYDAFPGMYLKAQSEALAEAEERTVRGNDDASSVIRFNSAGNISQAGTLYFTGKGGQRRIVMELGTGRLVMKDE